MDGKFGKCIYINKFTVGFYIIKYFFPVLKNYTVEVFSYPLSTLHPTRETILIPSARLTEPLLTSDLGYLNEQLLLFSKVIHNSGLSCVGCTLVDKNIYCKLVVKEMKRKCSMSVICLFVISSFAFFF